MASNLDAVRTQLDELIAEGVRTLYFDLGLRAGHYTVDELFEHARPLLEERGTIKAGATATEASKKKAIASVAKPFTDYYETWYSQGLAVLRQLLPERVNDFIGYYKLERRKEVTFATYTLSDFCIGLTMTRWDGVPVFDAAKSAYTKFEQQIAILQAAKSRFDSQLFDIRSVVRADLHDSELDAARELLKHGYLRAAGVVAGVVLEGHLGEVVRSHAVQTRKRTPTIADFNDLLKTAGVVNVQTWRFIQRLGDLRNLCGHNKGVDPSKDEVEELIAGVEKVSKTIA